MRLWHAIAVVRASVILALAPSQKLSADPRIRGDEIDGGQAPADDQTLASVRASRVLMSPTSSKEMSHVRRWCCGVRAGGLTVEAEGEIWGSSFMRARLVEPEPHLRGCRR